MSRLRSMLTALVVVLGVALVRIPAFASTVHYFKPSEDAQQDYILFASKVYEFTHDSCLACVQEAMMADLLPTERVGLLTNSHSEFVQYKHDLTAMGVSSCDLSNFFEVSGEHSDIWMQDYTIPDDYWTTPRGASGKAWVDFDFDGWGFEQEVDASLGVLGYYDTDDGIPAELRTALGGLTLSSTLIAEGGAIESNGLGTIVYSLQALSQRQPTMTQAAIEAELGRTTGGTHFLSPPYTHLADGQPINDPPILFPDGERGQVFGVRHIDETTVIVAPTCVGGPTIILTEWLDPVYADPNFPAELELQTELEANYQFWLAATDQSGNHFDVRKLPDPGLRKVELTADDAAWSYMGLVGPTEGYDPNGGALVLASSYANMVVTNHAVLVPQVDDDTDPTIADRNAEALAVAADAFPGRTIYPFDDTVLTENGGGEHCITMPVTHPVKH